MDVVYTNDSVENEPGPNLYWRGSPVEYTQLLIDLRALGVANGTIIYLEQLKYIRLVGIQHYIFASAANGATLSKIHDGEVLTELNPALWRRFLHNVLSISFCPSFVYQEFEEAQVIEQANIIMSSQI